VPPRATCSQVRKRPHRSGVGVSPPRRGKSERYAGGGDLDPVGWHGGNNGMKPHPVGVKAPRGLGLFDINGNLHEWCEDKREPEIGSPAWMRRGG
jgi:formylglycine-generating enzyme required for sulfatase activity